MPKRKREEVQIFVRALGETKVLRVLENDSVYSVKAVMLPKLENRIHNMTLQHTVTLSEISQTAIGRDFALHSRQVARKLASACKHLDWISLHA
jgi:hypothetical protein